jgi:hypothetical protein
MSGRARIVPIITARRTVIKRKIAQCGIARADRAAALRRLAKECARAD